MKEKEKIFEFPRKVNYPIGMMFTHKNSDGSGKICWIITEIIDEWTIKARPLEQ